MASSCAGETMDSANSVEEEPPPWELIGQVHGPSTWGSILDVDTAVSHTCALSSAGELHCWGRNLNGAFGIGNTTDQVLPIRTPNPTGLHIEAFDTSDAHTCAIYSDASVRCWGDNTYGQLGDGTTTSRLSPTSVILGGTLAPVQISVGTDHSCLLFDDGSVSCWGSNSHGQLGVTSSTTSTASPLLPISQWMWSWCRSARGPPPHAACQAQVRSGAGAATTFVNWVRVMPRIEMSPPRDGLRGRPSRIASHGPRHGGDLRHRSCWIGRYADGLELDRWDHLGRIESHALGPSRCACGIDGDHGAGHPPRLHAEQGPCADRVAADRR